MSESKSKDLKMLGVTEDEMKRSTAYKKMGLTEEAFIAGNEIHARGPQFAEDPNKVERVTGSTEDQINRSKAIKHMGTTEEEIDEERMKQLSALGHK